MPPDPILATRNLTKQFRSFCAVDQISMQVTRGTIHALLGPNGAGKTTFFNLLTKFLQPSSGAIIFEGNDITLETPFQIARRGIIRSFQISSVFPHLSALENVRLSLQRRQNRDFNFWSRDAHLASLDKKAFGILESLGLAALATQPASTLAYGQKRALELGTTLAMEPTLLLLDEPTQGLGHEDIADVISLIRQAAQGRTVLMVEHNMDVIANLCDQVTVLQRGKVIAEGTYEEVSKNPAVLDAYLGQSESLEEAPHG